MVFQRVDHGLGLVKLLGVLASRGALYEQARRHNGARVNFGSCPQHGVQARPVPVPCQPQGNRLTHQASTRPSGIGARALLQGLDNGLEVFVLSCLNQGAIGKGGRGGAEGHGVGSVWSGVFGMIPVVSSVGHPRHLAPRGEWGSLGSTFTI